MNTIQVGMSAPFFSGIDQNDQSISLSDFAGKKVLLYFYPKDDTETCTKQACNLRDNYALLQQSGWTIIGISPDTTKSHRKFMQKYALPFTLIADTDLVIAKDYGVWQWKKFMGREYMGIVRTTFLIDENGIIERIIDKVKAKDHANQLLV